MATLACTRWSTCDVAPADRIDYWNSKNTDLLVGLRSASFDHAAGLVAAQANYDLGNLRMADISGNQHVIERHADLIRSHPKPAVFASLILRSEGFFYQGKACHALMPGDLIFYDTQRPYVIGFTDRMRQLVFDCPVSFFDAPGLQAALTQPIKVDGGQGEARWLVAALRHQGWQLAQAASGPAGLDATRASIATLLQATLSSQVNGGVDARFASSYLAAAQAYIARHLDDADLQGEQVAAALGISFRHLNRVFNAHADSSVARYIRQQRLQAAHRDLLDPRQQGLDIHSIACKWGFVSQSHFTRVFRQAYGQTPSQVRQQR